MSKPITRKEIETATIKLNSQIPTVKKTAKRGVSPADEYNMERFRENYHIISDREPLTSGTVDVIVESMKMYGFDKKKPIMRYEGKIADGRHRFIASEYLGIEPIYEEVTGTYDEVMELADKENNARRHKSIAQRAVIAAKDIIMRNEQREDLKREILLKEPKIGRDRLAGKINKKLPIFPAAMMEKKHNVNKDYINQCVKYYRETEYDAAHLCNMLELDELNMTQAKAKYKAAMSSIRASERPPVHLDEDQEILLEKKSMAKEHPDVAAYEIVELLKAERKYKAKIEDLENKASRIDDLSAELSVAHSMINDIDGNGKPIPAI